MTLARRINNLIHPKLGKILMLHRVSATLSLDPALRHLQITPTFLEETITSLLNSGYDFIAIGEVMQRIIAPKRHKPFVCFTFDDGYLDTLTTAIPLLQRYNIPFCIYLTSHFFDGTAVPHWDTTAAMLSASDVRSLSQNPLCTIGAHTVSHPRLSSLNAEQQQAEIFNNKLHLEQIVSKPVVHFAYPHGDYNDQTVAIVHQAGFQTAVTCSGRHIRSNSKPLTLDRISLQQP